jgi:hypothetical protein
MWKEKEKGRKKKRKMGDDQDARPRSTARRNASPADCGAESLANVPAFIAANTFTGFVSFCGVGPAATPFPNEGCPKPGLNPVGSA